MHDWQTAHQRPNRFDVQLKIRNFAIEVSVTPFNLGPSERGEELGGGVRYLPGTVST